MLYCMCQTECIKQCLIVFAVLFAAHVCGLNKDFLKNWDSGDFLLFVLPDIFH